MIACPHCGSAEHYFKVSALYEGETATVAGGGIGMGLSGGLGVGVGSGTKQTLLAEKLSPPVQPERPGPAIVAYIFATLAAAATVGVFLISEWWAGVIAAVITVAICVVVPKSHRAYVAKREAFPGELERWQRQWVCKRCGEISDPNSSTQSSNQ